MQLAAIRQIERRYGAYGFGLIAALLLLWAVRPAADLSANMREAALSNERAALHLATTAATFERLAPRLTAADTDHAEAQGGNQ